MKRIAGVVFGVVFLCLVFLGCGGSSSDPVDDVDNPGDPDTRDDGLRMGLLQFRVTHNLQDDSCLQDTTCDLKAEAFADTGGWLAKLRADSNMAVLHWDRALPWLVFDENPPPGADRVEFFDSRIDSSLKGWLDAFVTHFDSMPSGYLAVSVLSGDRDRLQSFRLDDTRSVDVTGECPVVSPGTQISFEYDPGGGPVSASFDLSRSYTNFVLYLYDKLQPDYLALMVEINLYKEMDPPCPDRWDGMVQLYRHVYDTVRPQVDPQTKVFATLTLQHLLDYDQETCPGPLRLEPCTGDPSPPDYTVPDAQACYPMDLSAVTDLDQGGRLEILALSFYPDALLMDVADDNIVKLFPKDWDGTGECAARAQALPYIDPTAALDRLNWSKPIAIAELGARSDHTLFAFEEEAFLVQPPADLTSQSFWLDLFLKTARQREFEFYVQSFSEDYEVLGYWTVPHGLMDAETYSLFNNFAHMGIYDDQGQAKPGVTQTWMDALP